LEDGDTTALDALLSALDSTESGEAASDDATPGASKHHKHKHKHKKKKKKKKLDRSGGATWMPWGADGIARSCDGSGDECDSDEAVEKREDDDTSPVASDAEEERTTDAQATESGDGEPAGEKAEARTVESPEELACSVPSRSESQPAAGVPDAAAVPAEAVVKPAKSSGARGAPPVRLHPSTVAALPPHPLGLSPAALAPPPLVLPGGAPSLAAAPPPKKADLPAPTPAIEKAVPAAPAQADPAADVEHKAAAAVEPTTLPPATVVAPASPAEEAAASASDPDSSAAKASEPEGASAQPAEPEELEKAEETSANPRVRPIRSVSEGAKLSAARDDVDRAAALSSLNSMGSSGTGGKMSLLLSGGLSGAGNASDSSDGRKSPTKKGSKGLFRSIGSRKSSRGQRARKAVTEGTSDAGNSLDDQKERRRTLNLGSPRDDIVVTKKRKKGVVRSLSAKGMSLVTKKKDGFITLSPFQSLDSNELCWSDVQPSDATNESLQPHLRGFLCDLETFNYECGCVEATAFQRKLVVEQQHLDVKFFEDHFEKGKYDTYVAGNVEHPWVMAVAKVKSLKKTLVYINNGETVYRLSTDPGAKAKEILLQVPRYSPKLADAIFELVKGCTTYSDILRLEQFDHRPQYTIGVLYCAEGQTTEREMYNNMSGSPEFDEFLSMLGDKVELKGWPRFPGGLDVNRNKTGTHSLYTMLRQYEVMYHVSTMLPYMEHDEQKLERKRHIGNDMVVVIFKEGDQKLDPKLFDSHFNFVFVIVQRVPPEEAGDGGIVYSVEFCYNKTVPAPARPALPSPAFLKAGSRSRDLLVTKLMNAERMCLGAAEFQEKLRRTKRHMIDFMVERYVRAS